ncbi:MAG: hypothetical protein Q8W48_04360 [Candidatus Palauibacterales bacterium]|nr:hypothetical protein [Candidatus Palauibacterales bacterium]
MALFVPPLSLTGMPDAGLAQETTYDLQLSDRVGDSNLYRMVFRIEMRADYSGAGAMEDRARQMIEALASGMELRTSIEYEQRLTAVDPDGTRTFAVTWHDYKFEGKVGDRSIPPPPGHTEATRALLSGTATMRTSPVGRTLDVRYSSPELEALGGRFRELNESMPTSLPGEPVAVGDSWTSVTPFRTGLEPAGDSAVTNLEVQHMLREVLDGTDGPLAVIELSGSYSQLQGLELPGVASPMHVQFTVTGSALFDITRGRFAAGSYQLDMFALHAVNGVELQLTGFANGTLELMDAS